VAAAGRTLFDPREVRLVITVHLADAAERHLADGPVRRVCTGHGLGEQGLHAEGEACLTCRARPMIATRR
jgi:hypothetical protein